ncbi:hypothetical protein BH09MYX1_BH09MYX1_31270 [soil metagenome]
MRFVRLALPLLLVAGVAWGEGISVAEAAKRFAEGQDLFAHGKYPDAYTKFVEACAAHHTPDCPKNLAVTEMRLDKHADAATHFREYLQSKEGAADREVAMIRQLYVAEQVKVGEIHVSAKDGAIIKIDDKVEGKAPIATTIYVTPGPHKVTAVYGDLVEERSVVVEPKALLEVDANPKGVGTVPTATTTAAPTATTPPPPPSSATPKWIAGGALAGVGVLGLIGWGAFAAVSNGARSDGDGYANSGVCGGAGATSPRCADFQSTVDRQNTFHVVSLVSLVGGLVFLASGGALLAWAATSKASVTVVPQATRAGGGLTIEGRF